MGVIKKLQKCANAINYYSNSMYNKEVYLPALEYSFTNMLPQTIDIKSVPYHNVDNFNQDVYPVPFAPEIVYYCGNDTYMCKSMSGKTEDLFAITKDNFKTFKFIRPSSVIGVNAFFDHCTDEHLYLTPAGRNGVLYKYNYITGDVQVINLPNPNLESESFQVSVCPLGVISIFTDMTQPTNSYFCFTNKETGEFVPLGGYSFLKDPDAQKIMFSEGELYSSLKKGNILSIYTSPDGKNWALKESIDIAAKFPKEVSDARAVSVVKFKGEFYVVFFKLVIRQIDNAFAYYICKSSDGSIVLNKTRETTFRCSSMPFAIQVFPDKLFLNYSGISFEFKDDNTIDYVLLPEIFTDRNVYDGNQNGSRAMNSCHYVRDKFGSIFLSPKTNGQPADSGKYLVTNAKIVSENLLPKDI